MAYAGMAYGHSNNFYAPAGYTQQMHPDFARQMQMQAYRQSPDGDQQMFERGLQQQEQQRKAFDSETMRQGQQQKYGLLGNLLTGTRTFYGR